MKSYLLLGLLLFFCAIALVAQDQHVDVIRLKRGGIIKGKLIEADTTKTMKIVTLGGSDFSFEWSDVASLSSVGLATSKDSSVFSAVFNPLNAAQSDSATMYPDKKSNALKNKWYLVGLSNSEYGSVALDSLKDEYLFTTKESEHKVFSLRSLQSLQYGSSSGVLTGSLLGLAGGFIGGIIVGGFIGMVALDDPPPENGKESEAAKLFSGLSSVGKIAKGASVGGTVGLIAGPVAGGMLFAPDNYSFEGKSIEERKTMVMKIFTSEKKK